MVNTTISRGPQATQIRWLRALRLALISTPIGRGDRKVVPIEEGFKTEHTFIPVRGASDSDSWRQRLGFLAGATPIRGGSGPVVSPFVAPEPWDVLHSQSPPGAFWSTANIG